MPKKRHRRMSGLSVEKAMTVCSSHYKEPIAVKICQDTARSIIKRLVANKPTVCKKWCGCP